MPPEVCDSWITGVKPSRKMVAWRTRLRRGVERWLWGCCWAPGDHEELATTSRQILATTTTSALRTPISPQRDSASHDPSARRHDSPLPTLYASLHNPLRGPVVDPRRLGGRVDRR